MTLSFDQFVAEIKIVQDTYNMAKSGGLDTWPALNFLNEVQVRDIDTSPALVSLSKSALMFVDHVPHL